MINVYIHTYIHTYIQDIDEEDYEDQDAIHTLQVSGKRLEAQRRETEQLFYCLSGAGIFFKRTDVDT